jgi:serine/threonine protein kinase
MHIAVKVLSNSSLTPRQRKFQQREIHLHALLSPHPSVLSLHKTIETPTHTFLITDLLPSGDLFALITDQRTYVGRDDLISSVFDQLCSAVQFCHEWGVGHRDLKPENVFCDAGGARVVIGDFGLATTEKRSAEFGCGSSFYISPGELKPCAYCRGSRTR